MGGNSPEIPSLAFSSLSPYPRTVRSFSNAPDHLPYIRRARYLDMLLTRLDKPRAFEDRREGDPVYRDDLGRFLTPELQYPPTVLSAPRIETMDPRVSPKQ